MYFLPFYSRSCCEVWTGNLTDPPDAVTPFSLVLDYNPILPDIQSIIRKHVHLLRSSPQTTEIFPAKSVFPAYRRNKSLKEILAPSKFRPSSAANQTVNKGDCFKCEKNRCDLCKNFLLQASKFQSSATGRHYPIRQKLSCSSKNVIYLATCCKCIYNMWVPHRLSLKLDSATINQICSTIEEHVNWRYIIIVPNMTFLK